MGQAEQQRCGLSARFVVLLLLLQLLLLLLLLQLRDSARSITAWRLSHAQAVLAVRTLHAPVGGITASQRVVSVLVTAILFGRRRLLLLRLLLLLLLALALLLLVELLLQLPHQQQVLLGAAGRMRCKRLG
jgi:hypothetical protein